MPTSMRPPDLSSVPPGIEPQDGAFGTTVSAVQTLLSRNYDCRTDLQQFIDTADITMGSMVACAARKGYVYTANQLEVIERWLSAHYYQQMDQGFQSKSTGGASASFMGQTTTSLDSTLYGQTAQNLDQTGCLVSISKSLVTRGIWLGKPVSQQIPYDMRD